VSKVANPLGVHAMVWIPEWNPANGAFAAKQAAALGYDLLELPLMDPGAVQVDATRQLFEGLSLGVTCSLGLSFATDVSSPDPAVAAAGEAFLLQAVEVAGGIGSSYLGGVVFSAMGKYHAPLSDAGRANCVRALANVARSARNHGVTLGLEVVNRYESNVLNTVSQALAMIEDIAQDNVKVHLDTYHANIEEVSIAQAVAQAGEALAYVHVGESHRGYLGTGSVDFQGLFSALRAARYQGPVTFESFSSRVVTPEFAAALAIWRDMWSDGDALAGHAKAFVEAGLSGQELPPAP
jgi:D-psicose/D-tagatose/L-ribulose 3-epimerase